MSRLTIYDAVNGLAVLGLAALLARAMVAGGWSGEDILYLLALPLLLIGGAFAVSLWLRRSHPEPAEECALCLVLPSALVMGAMIASLA